MNDTVDALTSPTLKHLREHWWDDAFTEFLAETLRPRPGNRILDVGCGEGLAEVAIGRLQVSQVRLVGVDLVPAKAAAAKRDTAVAQPARQLRCRRCRAGCPSGRQLRLHLLRGGAAARRPGGRRTRSPRSRASPLRGGRVVIVEPDNAARYTYSSLPSGMRAFDAAAGFFAALADGTRRGHRSVDRSQDGR